MQFTLYYSAKKFRMVSFSMRPMGIEAVVDRSASHCHSQGVIIPAIRPATAEPAETAIDLQI